MKDYEVDVLIVGGGTGGTAAAVSSRAMGQRVLVVEEFGAVGGQLTTQAVPPDEHPWIESTGCTASYRDFRNRVIRAFLTERVPECKQSGKQDDCRFDQNPFVERHGAPRVTLYFKIHVLSAFFNRQTKKRRMEIQLHAACGYRLVSGIIFSHSA